MSCPRRSRRRAVGEQVQKPLHRELFAGHAGKRFFLHVRSRTPPARRRRPHAGTGRGERLLASTDSEPRSGRCPAPLQGMRTAIALALLLAACKSAPAPERHLNDRPRSIPVPGTARIRRTCRPARGSSRPCVASRPCSAGTPAHRARPRAEAHVRGTRPPLPEGGPDAIAAAEQQAGGDAERRARPSLRPATLAGRSSGSPRELQRTSTRTSRLLRRSPCPGRTSRWPIAICRT